MNIGLHDGICEEKHRQAIGDAIWLYMWLVKRQTRRNGLVLGGTPITYQRIAGETNYPPQTIRRWMRVLRDSSYIEVAHLNFKHLRIRVLKAKKFGFKQLPLQMEETCSSERFSGETSFKNARLVRSDLNDGNAKSERSKQSGTLRSNEEPEQEKKAAAATAFASFVNLGVSEPFGSSEFKAAWMEEYDRIPVGGSFVDAMERTARRCQQSSVKVPSLFYQLKRKVEEIEIDSRTRRTPL